MSGAWGVDSNEDVKRVWKVAPGAEGATVEGFTVRLPAEGVIASPRHFGARIVDGSPLKIHRASLAVQVNNAFNAVDEQFREWAQGLLIFGSDVSTPGVRYLASGYQACKIVLADSTTYPHDLALTILTAAPMGASDITSPAAFASSAYAARSAVAPTTANLWVNKTTGARLPLANVVSYGALVEEPPFTRPTTFRS